MMHDELVELLDVSAIAGKENMNRIVTMNASIEERRRKLATLEGRIEDLRQIIHVGQKQMLVKTQTPRTEVINRVEELRVHRLVEQENM
jgi:cell division protein FtsB